jgi:hypothetical protein
MSGTDSGALGHTHGSLRLSTGPADSRSADQETAHNQKAYYRIQNSLSLVIDRSQFNPLHPYKPFTYLLRGLSPQTNYTDGRLSAKLVPTSADKGCHVVSVTDPNGRILGLLDRFFFFKYCNTSLPCRLCAASSGFCSDFPTKVFSVFVVYCMRPVNQFWVHSQNRIKPPHLS